MSYPAAVCLFSALLRQVDARPCGAAALALVGLDLLGGGILLLDLDSLLVRPRRPQQGHEVHVLPLWRAALQ